MNFGDAITALNTGHRVTRKGWNGRGMWISKTEGAAVHASKIWSHNVRRFAEGQPEQTVNVLPYLLMKTGNGDIQMGWLASQSDMLAEDWIDLDDDGAKQ